MNLESPTSTPAPADPEIHFAYAVLSRAAHTDPARLAGLPEGVGVQEAAHRLTVDAGSHGRALAEQAEADLNTAARCGARLITREDPGWPSERLAALAASGVRVAPIAWWGCGSGDLATLTRRAVAVTGARASTGYGEAVATEFATGLIERGWTVITGGGYGIEAAAHRAALAQAAPTLIITAGGIDRPYPPAHTELFERVADTGLILTETPPTLAARPAHFEHRGAVIAAVAQRFVLVEAGIRGHAIRNAGLAHLLGTPVFAVPGPIYSAQSRGCHQLIEAGHATLTTGITDILDDTATAP